MPGRGRPPAPRPARPCRHFWRTVPRSVSSPARRRAAELLRELAPRARPAASSASSCSPLGSDHAPASFLAQNGPPGWTSSTSTASGGAAVEQDAGAAAGHGSFVPKWSRVQVGSCASRGPGPERPACPGHGQRLPVPSADTRTSTSARARRRPAARTRSARRVASSSASRTTTRARPTRAGGRAGSSRGRAGRARARRRPAGTAAPSSRPMSAEREFRERFGERGQTAAEYMGILLLVGLIVAAIFSSGIGPRISRTLAHEVACIGAGGCAAHAATGPAAAARRRSERARHGQRRPRRGRRHRGSTLAQPGARGSRAREGRPGQRLGPAGHAAGPLRPPRRRLQLVLPGGVRATGARLLPARGRGAPADQGDARRHDPRLRPGDQRVRRPTTRTARPGRISSPTAGIGLLGRPAGRGPVRPRRRRRAWRPATAAATSEPGGEEPGGGGRGARAGRARVRARGARGAGDRARSCPRRSPERSPSPRRLAASSSRSAAERMLRIVEDAVTSMIPSSCDSRRSARTAS